MDNKPTSEELRQYADGELPAELLAEYPVAKKTQYEAPHLSNRLAFRPPRDSVWHTLRQWLKKIILVILAAGLPYAIGHILFPARVAVMLCTGAWAFYVVFIFLISVFSPKDMPLVGDWLDKPSQKKSIWFHIWHR